MPQEKIIIKFKPEGDKELIQAIKKLNVETKKLTGSNTAVTASTKGVTSSAKKFSTAAASLTAKLKAQNITWRQLGVSNEVLKKGYNSNRLALEKMRLAMTKAQATGALGVRNNRLLENSFATLRSQLLLFSFAMSMGIRQLMEFVSAASKVESMQRAFNTMSGGVGNATIAMNKLKVATNNTMSQFDLFQQANNAMILGVSKNSDEMAMMFDVAQRLGRALGRDTRSSVESLITGIGRQSRLMLDNIGLVIKAEEAYEAYAKELGVAADELTDADKKQAFLNETMRAARVAVKGLGEEIISTQDKIDELSSSWDDLKVSTGSFATVVLGLNKRMSDTSRILTMVSHAIGAAKLDINDAKTAFNFLADAIGVLHPVFRVFNFELEHESEELEQLISLGDNFGETFEDIGKTVGVAADRLGDFIHPQTIINKLFEKSKQGQIAVTQATLDQILAFTALEGTTNEAAGAIAELEAKLAKLKGLSTAELSVLEKKLAKLKETSVAQAEFITAIKDTNAALTDSSSAMSLEAESFSEVSLRVNEYAENLAKISELEAVPKEASKITTIFKEWGEEVNFTIPIIGKLSEAIDESSKKHQEDIANEIQALKDRNDELVTAGMEASDEGKFVALSKTTDEYNEQITLLREIAGINKIMAEFEPPKTFAEQAEAIIDDNEINALLLTEDEKKKIRDHFRGLEREANMQAIQEGLDMSLAAIGGLLSAQQGKLDAEVAAMKAGDEYQKASSRKREAMETAMQKKQASERNSIAEKERLAKGASALMNTYEAVSKAWAQGGVLGTVFAGIALAAGLAQVSAIASTPIPKFARGGMIGGRRHEQGGTMINAEQGEFVMSRNAVESVGLENLNRMNEGGGGGAVTVNVSGNVMSQDFVEGELSEQIREAVRRGTDFGIS